MKNLLLSCCALMLLCLATAPAVKAETKVLDNSPIAFEAGKMEYDKENKTVIATGNVVAEQKDSVLIADKLIYNAAANIVIAEGNVSLLSPDGVVIFADKMEVKDDLKEAIANNMRLVLADDSYLFAEKAAYNEGATSSFEDVTYTPCDRCAKSNPLWSVNAERVEKDDKEQMIRYYNAWLDFKGVPVFYTPYLSHPSPEVKRKSGFLLPSFSSNSELGFSAGLPYFWAVNESHDLTFTPTFTTKEGVLLNAAYRGRFTQGEINAKGGVTFADSARDNRSYIFSDFRYDINNSWRLKADVNLVSDKTFLRKYNIGNYNIPWLESDIRLEGFGAKTYFALRGMGFQELRYDIPNNFSPIVAPEMTYSYMGSPSDKGGYFTFDSYAAAITRRGDSQALGLAGSVQKINTLSAWHIPYIGPFGDIYKLQASLRLDGYSIHDFPFNSFNDDYSGFKGRAFPMISAEWRYPLIRNDTDSYQVLEPIISTVLSPNGCNPEEIPNEDSLDFEFDDTNLFSNNRFVGYDRVESGSRVNYGLNWSIYSNGGGKLTAFAGQSYSFSKNPAFLANTGLNEHFSDYVGKIELNLPVYNVTFNYRFRLEKKNLSPNKSEFSMAAGSDSFRIGGYFLDVKEISTEYSTVPHRKEVGLSANTKLNKYWKAGGWWTYDLLDGGSPVQWGGNIAYEDECFGLNLGVKKEYTKGVEDYHTGTTVMLTFTLKTLGSVQTNSF